MEDATSTVLKKMLSPNFNKACSMYEYSLNQFYQTKIWNNKHFNICLFCKSLICMICIVNYHTWWVFINLYFYICIFIMFPSATCKRCLTAYKNIVGEVTSELNHSDNCKIKKFFKCNNQRTHDQTNIEIKNGNLRNSLLDQLTS